MEPSIYSYSLFIALPLMLVFGFYFLLAKLPEKGTIFENYLRSRRIIGVAILLLAANYSIHLFFGIRFKNVDAAILMNLSTYFLCYWLFSSAFITLLDRFYITRRRIRTHICLWVIFSILSCIALLLLPAGILRMIALFALATWLVIYGFVLARRVILAYKRAIRIFNETYSDDIGAYIKWLSIFTWWALIFGVGCGLLTFLPDEYVYLWILSSIPFYIYLFCSYLNYLLFYEQVESAMENEITSKGEEIRCAMEQPKTSEQETPSYHAQIAEKIKEWTDAGSYVRTGLTIMELSDLLHTNRTYLSEYIKTTYDMTFRDWITGLRIDYAKRLLVENSRLTIADISERSGFQSPSHFIRLFKENVGCTPTQWRRKEAK